MKKEIIAIIGAKGIPKDFKGTSGVESYIEQQCINEINKGNTVICYVRKWAQSNSLKHYKGVTLVTVPTINTKILDTITYSFISSLHASLNNATIVWYHGIGPAFFCYIPKFFQKKIYTTIHSLDWKRIKWGKFARYFLKISEIIAFRASDKIFVVSAQLHNYCAANYSAPTVIDKYHILPQKPVKPCIIKSKYHIKTNTYLLFMGRFVPEKRIEWLISAARLLGMKVVLCGGSSHTDEYEKKLRLLGSHNSVLFCDYVFGVEKKEFLSNCKLFVLPSMVEGYPIAVIEALSYNRNCLIGDFLNEEFSADNAYVHYFKTESYDDFVRQLRKAAML